MTRPNAKDVYNEVLKLTKIDTIWHAFLDAFNTVRPKSLNLKCTAFLYHRLRNAPRFGKFIIIKIKIGHEGI